MRKLLIIAPLALLLFACSNDNATQKKDVDNDMFGSSNPTEKEEDYKSPLQLEDIHIKLTPYVAESEQTKDASKLLRDRLNSAIVKIGFGGEGSNPRLPEFSDVTSARNYIPRKSSGSFTFFLILS